MAKYELTLIFKTSLTEDKIDAIIEKLKIKEKKRANWGKRLLAYTINKEKEGIYYCLTIENDQEQIKDLRKKLEIEDLILRYLLIRV